MGIAKKNITFTRNKNNLLIPDVLPLTQYVEKKKDGSNKIEVMKMKLKERKKQNITKHINRKHDMFGSSDHSGSMTNKFQRLLPQCNVSSDEVNFVNKDHWSAWNRIGQFTDSFPEKVSGGIFLYPLQQELIVHLIQTKLNDRQTGKDHKPFRICETGFGAGHSASLFLSISKDIQVFTFDKFDRPYQKPIVEFLKGKFGTGRLKIIQGDSCKTVPKYLEKNDFAGCDFLHGSSLCKSDNIDLIRHSNCDTMLTSTAMKSLSDHAVYFGPKAQWRKLRDDGCITDISCFQDKAKNLDKKYIFSRPDTGVIRHKFCFAVNTGICHYSERHKNVGCKSIDSINRMISQFDFCQETKVEPPK